MSLRARERVVRVCGRGCVDLGVDAGVRKHMHRHVHTYVSLHIYKYASIYIHTYVSLHIKRMYLYTYIRMYGWIRTNYIHAHTNVYIRMIHT